MTAKKLPPAVTTAPTFSDAVSPDLPRLKRETERHLRGVVESLGVGDAIDFTNWLVALARELGGYDPADD